MARFTVNGREVQAEDDRLLLWVLRTELGLTGARYGCGEGACGACTVLVDGEAEQSCQTRVRELEGCKVVTIEGLAQGEELHPVQQAFVDHWAMQCGFCTPGMVLAACSLLKRTSKPTREQIKQAMNNHLCRCGAYERIVAAIEGVAR